MQKGIRKHAWRYVIVAVLIAVVLVSLYYQFGYLPQKQSETSSKETVGSDGRSYIASSISIATLSFSNETGFETTVYPTSGTIEFVLSPNSVGEFTVTYTGIASNDLTMSFFTNPVSDCRMARLELAQD